MSRMPMVWTVVLACAAGVAAAGDLHVDNVNAYQDVTVYGKLVMRSFITNDNAALVLQANGSSGATVFTNSASASHPFTAHGNACIRTNAPKFGGGAIQLDGNGDYLTSPGDADWNFGTADFTIDGWINPATAPWIIRLVAGGTHADGAGNMWFFGLGNGWSGGGATVMNFGVYDGAGYWENWWCGTPFTVTTGVWNHWALVRSGSRIHGFWNGVKVYDWDMGSVAQVNSGASGLIIGARYAATMNTLCEYVNGQMDEVRVMRGVAKWTSDFTPPPAEWCPGLTTNKPLTNAVLQVEGGIQVLGSAQAQSLQVQNLGAQAISLNGQAVSNWNQVVAATNFATAAQGAKAEASITNNYAGVATLNSNLVVNGKVGVGGVNTTIAKLCVKSPTASWLTPAMLIEDGENRQLGLSGQDIVIRPDVNSDVYSYLDIGVRGYNYGTTRYRDTHIGNGRGIRLLSVIGCTGNVGVGTNTPAAKLHVVGNVRVDGTITGDGSGLTNITAAQVGAVSTANISSIIYSNVSDFATALQGVRMESAVQTNHVGDVRIRGGLSVTTYSREGCPLVSPVTNTGITWQDLPVTASWGTMGMSDDGRVMVASVLASGAAGPLMVSTNFGQAWRTIECTNVWYDFDGSADGRIFVAAVRDGQLWMSKDYGQSWVPLQSSPVSSWESVAMSSDGRYITAGNYGSALWMSSDYGVTWDTNSMIPPSKWLGVDMSRDGKNQIIASRLHAVMMMSTNWGREWYQLTNAPARDWRSVSLSDDGQHIIAAAYWYMNGACYSTNGGATWTSVGGPQVGECTCISANGRYMAYTHTSWTHLFWNSTDYGKTWTQRSTEGGLWQPCVSSDGAIATVLTYDRIKCSRGYDDPQGYVLFRVNEDGNVGIGLNAPEARLHVAGDIRADGVIYGNGMGISGLSAEQVGASASNHTHTAREIGALTQEQADLRYLSAVGGVVNTLTVTNVTVSGRMTLGAGAVFYVHPQGDLSMGAFTNGPAQ